MPKEGWKSVTINEEVLEKWEDAYDLNKDLLRQKGITTFGGFVNSLMFGIINDPKIMIAAIEKGNQILLDKFKIGK